MVPFKDVVRFIFNKAKEKDPGLTEAKFAEQFKISRSIMSRILSGSYVPEGLTVRKIIEGSKDESGKPYKLVDCIELPEMRAERDKLLAAAEALLERDDALADWLRDYIELREWKTLQETTEVANSRPPPHSKKRRRA